MARTTEELEYKDCLVCGKTYDRNPKESNKQWSVRRFCSRGCGTQWRWRDHIPVPKPVRRAYHRSDRHIRRDGYIDTWSPDHPVARADGYVFEHRKIAWDAGLLTDPKLQVHHTNGDRQDNRLVNLEVLSIVAHTERHRDERRRRSNGHPQSPLTADDVRAIRAALKAGERQIPLAARYGVSQAVISKIKLRQSWAHV